MPGRLTLRHSELVNFPAIGEHAAHSMSMTWAIAAFCAAVPICALRPAARLFGRTAGAINSTFRAVAATCALSIAAGLVPSLLSAVPPPSTHDEFAYLLAADTFSHGRLTNPTPQDWQHFETFHEIMRPSYMAKFPPGQGLALAAGQALGLTIAGAFVTIALACGAVAWMLCAWMPPRWAALGGFLAALQPTIFFWGQSYWGGGVAMLGGALLGGAFARALRRPTFRIGMVGGGGAAILANSRPFEGALLCVILLVALATLNWRACAKMILPGAVIVAPAFAWMLYYNWRVTGDALVMPYAVHARQYMMSPLFWWQPAPQPPPYQHAKLREYYELHEHAEYSSRRPGFTRFAAGVWHDLLAAGREFLTPLSLAVPLLALPSVLRGRRAARVSCIVIAAFLILHFSLTPWMRAQYLAPLAGFFFAVICLCGRRMARRRVGGAIVRAVLVVQVIAVAVMIVQLSRNSNPPGSTRARELARLEALPGKHLVIVRYAPGRQSLFEWVWNRADIPNAKVIFARELDNDSNQQLILDYPGRKIWLLSIDGLRYSLDPIR